MQASARLEQDLRHQLKQQNVEMEASNNKMSRCDCTTICWLARAA